MIQNIYIVKFPIDEDYLNDTKNDINSEITIKNETIEEKKNNPDIIVNLMKLLTIRDIKLYTFIKKRIWLIY